MHDLLSGLNPKQQEAVLTTDGPVLILAGPGSGKTRCITNRFAYLLLEKKIPGYAILSITFTNKAAAEMKERIKHLLESFGIQGHSFPWITTFHSACAKILRREGELLSVGKDFVIYDTKDQEEVIKKAVKELNLNPKQYTPGMILNAISSAKNEMLTPSQYNSFANTLFQEVVSKVYKIYQKTLQENKAMDFDDLLLETILLLQKNPEVLEKYQKQFQYIQVDEYQDTNSCQYTLTKLLALKHHNLCVVGDPGQGIYSWRGADIRNILEFEKDYPEAKVIKLEQNYRSTKVIIQAASQILNKTGKYPEMNLWTDNSSGSKISIYESYTEQDEAYFIADTISALCLPFKGQPPVFQYRDFAILYRTNAQSRVLEEIFIKESIPYRLFGGVKFYERKEIKDVIAYLRLTVNPTDEVALTRASKTGKRRVKRFLDWLQGQTFSEMAPMQILDEALKNTEYIETLEDGSEEGKSRIENVKELRSVAQNFATVTELLENIALIQDETTPSGDELAHDDPNAVTLMTLHSAKGLEFPVVFMAGVEEGLLPHVRAISEPTELEEERRLCYVGITRAKQKVFLTYASKRRIFGSENYNLPSRFIEEIDANLVMTEK